MIENVIITSMIGASGDVHALHELAQEDIEKMYQDGCKELVKKMIEKAEKRIKLAAELEEYNKQFLAAYDNNDRELVHYWSEKIAENLKG